MSWLRTGITCLFYRRPMVINAWRSVKEIILMPKANYVFDMEPYIVDKGTPVETIFENLEAMELPQFFEGLKFESWERGGYIDSPTIETSGSYYYVSANYSNCMVRDRNLEAWSLDMVRKARKILHTWTAMWQKRARTVEFPGDRGRI